jgi:hypothetical protein
MPDGRRVVTAVTEVQGMEGDTILLQDIFRYKPGAGVGGKATGELGPTGLRPKFLDKLEGAGVEVPAKVFRSSGSGRTASSEGRARPTHVPSQRELAEAEGGKTR